jgi:hypothetical protein
MHFAIEPALVDPDSLALRDEHEHRIDIAGKIAARKRGRVR